MFTPFCQAKVKREAETGASSTKDEPVRDNANKLFADSIHPQKHRLPFNLPLSLPPFYPRNLNPLPLHPSQFAMGQGGLNFNMYGSHYGQQSDASAKNSLNYDQLKSSNHFNLLNEMMKSYSGVTAAIHMKHLMSLMHAFPLLPNFDALKASFLNQDPSKKLPRKPNVRAYSKVSSSSANDAFNLKPTGLRGQLKSDEVRKTKDVIKPVVMRGITKPKTHMCPYCGKFYSRKYGLKIHIRTHTGYKPLKCKVSNCIYYCC